MNNKINNKIDQEYSAAQVKEILKKGNKYDQSETYLNDISDVWSFPSEVFLELIDKSPTKRK
jgi:hypothetical protein